MLKPYTRQQIQTNKVLASIDDIYERNILEHILTHKDTLYNIKVLGRGDNTLLRNMITNTDSVVIVIGNCGNPIILDENGGDILSYMTENEFVGTKSYTVYGTSYIIETNYKSIRDVYIRLRAYS